MVGDPADQVVGGQYQVRRDGLGQHGPFTGPQARVSTSGNRAQLGGRQVCHQVGQPRGEGQQKDRALGKTPMGESHRHLVGDLIQVGVADRRSGRGFDGRAVGVAAAGVGEDPREHGRRVPVRPDRVGWRRNGAVDALTRSIGPCGVV